MSLGKADNRITAEPKRKSAAQKRINSFKNTHGVFLRDFFWGEEGCWVLFGVVFRLLIPWTMLGLSFLCWCPSFSHLASLCWVTLLWLQGKSSEFPKCALDGTAGEGKAHIARYKMSLAAHKVDFKCSVKVAWFYESQLYWQTIYRQNAIAALLKIVLMM